MGKLVQNDKSSVTGSNLEKIVQETGIKTLDASSWQIREALAPPEPPDNELWRISLLEKYLTQRNELEQNLLDTKEIDTLIESLCTT